MKINDILAICGSLTMMWTAISLISFHRTGKGSKDHLDYVLDYSDGDFRTIEIKTIHKNAIQIENELPGSPEWILSKPALNREVEGYMSRTSIQKGDKISLYYNVNPIATKKKSPEPVDVKIEVFRTGWYDGVGARKMFGPILVPGITQQMPTPGQDGLLICKWRDPYIIQTYDSWTTGVYLVKMTEMNPSSMRQSYAIFVLRDDYRNSSSSSTPDIMFQLPFNTYQAYNIWGGRNLYRCNLSKGCQEARKVSFDRPFAAPENEVGAFGTGAGEYLSNVQPIQFYPIKTTASWNYNMVRWMERNHLDVSYISNSAREITLSLNKLSCLI